SVAMPGPFVEGDGIDDERVPFPVRGFVAVEERLQILRLFVRAAIGVHHAPAVVVLNQMNQLTRLGVDLMDVGVVREHPGHTDWRAVDVRASEFQVHSAEALVLRFSPRLERNRILLLPLLRQYAPRVRLSCRSGKPDTGEIDMTV